MESRQDRRRAQVEVCGVRRRTMRAAMPQCLAGQTKQSSQRPGTLQQLGNVIASLAFTTRSVHLGDDQYCSFLYILHGSVLQLRKSIKHLKYIQLYILSLVCIAVEYEYLKYMRQSKSNRSGKSHQIGGGI